jgi:hypothetical protein
MRKFPLAKRQSTINVSPVHLDIASLDPEVKAVLEEFPTVIAINPKKPANTDLVEFKVEVENEKPVLFPPPDVCIRTSYQRLMQKSTKCVATALSAQ